MNKYKFVLRATKRYAAKDLKYQHIFGFRDQLSNDGFSNHQRCIQGRAERMGISVKTYQRMFPPDCESIDHTGEVPF